MGTITAITRASGSSQCGGETAARESQSYAIFEGLMMRQRRHSMKTYDGNKTVSQIARRGLVLVALLATALICVRAGHAQSTTTSMPAPNPKPPEAAARTAAPAPPATSPSRGGLKTGVKVHGYWKIDVRNPEGKLASHTEFENSLTTNDPNGLSGDYALAYLLSGGGRDITVTGDTDFSTLSENSLAAFLAAWNAAEYVDGRARKLGISSFTVQFPYFVIGVNTAGFVAGSGGAINYLLPGPCGSSPCETPTTQSANGNTLSLNTTFVASASSTITEVGTFVASAKLRYGAGAEWMQIVYSPLGSAIYTFTSANLGLPGSCGGQSQPACQVSVSPGQTVAVSVTFSFD
jgi:hypothetical protein